MSDSGDSIVEADDMKLKKNGYFSHESNGSPLGSIWKTVSSTRFTVAYMGFLGFFLVYSMRVNISVALVDMVVKSNENNTGNQNCPVHDSSNSSDSGHSGSFDWSSSQQANVLGAFYYGYMVTQIPSGLFVSQRGGKLLYGLGILLTGVFTILTPPAATLGVGWLIGLRILEGITEAATFPAYNQLMGQWVPKYERSYFSAFACSGGTLGNVITNPVVGYLCTLHLFGGWPLGFYANGALAIVWYIAWCFLVYDNPDSHPRISQEERLHIKRNTGTVSKKLSIPWYEIFTCRPFYGLLASHVCCNFINYGIMSCLPQYLSNVLNFDISSNGVLSALPWLCCWIAIQLFSNLTDFLRKKKVCSTTVIRKINAFIGSFFPGLFLVLAGYARCDDKLAVSFIVIAMFFFGANMSSYNCNNLDIAPNYAGVLFSITNTAATIPGFVAPVVVNWITQDDIHSETLWRYAFFTFAGVGWFGGLMFILLASGEIQPWAVSLSGEWEAFLDDTSDDSNNSCSEQGEINVLSESDHVNDEHCTN